MGRMMWMSMRISMRRKETMWKMKRRGVEMMEKTRTLVGRKGKGRRSPREKVGDLGRSMLV
jgi:hypothetical protein